MTITKKYGVSFQALLQNNHQCCPYLIQISYRIMSLLKKLSGFLFECQQEHYMVLSIHTLAMSILSQASVTHTGMSCSRIQVNISQEITSIFHVKIEIWDDKIEECTMHAQSGIFCPQSTIHCGNKISLGMYSKTDFTLNDNICQNK